MIRGITICVDYDDLLAISLPQNLQHLAEVLVVTAPHDVHTQRLAASLPNVRVHVTDAFYRQGAIFNKGLAMEEGLDALGRHGQLMIFDADTVLPRVIAWPVLRPDCLYTPERHLLHDLAQWREDLDWSTLPVKRENEWPGYCQIFSAGDPRLVGRRPWYGTDWYHAGGCDSDFQQLWPASHKLRPGFRVLHLGLDGQNWCGRVTQRLDGEQLPDQPTRQRLMSRVNREHAFRYQKLPPQ